MTTPSLVGNYCLALAVLASAGGVLAAFSSVRFGSTELLIWTRRAVHATTALLTVASMALVWAFVDNDFRMAYVVQYSELALPLGYKLAAFWAGRQGSLLLWAWMLAVVASMVARRPPKDHAHQGAVLGILAGICTLFPATILFAPNPFELAKIVPADGHGLNPMLQDPAMLSHPPLLFLGYAGFAVSLAMVLGALLVRRTDRGWIASARRWTVASWVFLTLGIVLGCWWAYIELGWGGYWAWDPVENASLLPWLTGTALIHSLIAWQRRGTLKAWTAALAAVTFILTIFGTYLTRSGVIKSVHAYAESPAGWFFLAMVGAGVVLSVALMLWRRDLLKPDRAIERLVSPTGAFLAAAILLTLMMLTTLVGTIFPVLARPFTDHGMTQDERFFNTAVLPMALALTAVMGIGPMLRPAANQMDLKRRLTVPGAAAVAAALIAAGMGWTSIWMLFSAAVGALVVFAVGEDFIVRTFGSAGEAGRSGLASAGRSLRANARRYGGQLAHLGMALVVIAVAGSSLYSTKTKLRLHPGQSARVGPYVLNMGSLEEVKGQNYVALEARLTLRSPSGETTALRPQHRQYDKSAQKSTEVAIHSTLLRDVYLRLDGWTPDGQTALIQVIVNPLVDWLWIGTIVMTAGGLLCLAVGRPKTPRSAGMPADSDSFSGPEPSPRYAITPQETDHEEYPT